MGITRSTFYDRPQRPADDTANVSRRKGRSTGPAYFRHANVRSRTMLPIYLKLLRQHRHPARGRRGTDQSAATRFRDIPACSQGGGSLLPGGACRLVETEKGRSKGATPRGPPALGDNWPHRLVRSLDEEFTMRVKQLIAMVCVLAPFGVGAAQGASPLGTWRDLFGTTFILSKCDRSGDLCATLKDIQGKSRTPENLAYLNKRILHMHQSASNQWQGTLIFNGSQAQGTVTRIGNDTLSIKGCRGIFCGVLLFRRA
jgi:hypothetical protein